MAAQQLGMVVDASVCLDCKACLASCKVANQVPDGNWRNWIKPNKEAGSKNGKRQTVFQPGGCMHCSTPTCVAACPTGATYKNEADGTVLIDRELCIGCGQCIPACPYGARYRHPELKIADKCDFCKSRRAQDLEPACVSTCPTKARIFGDLNDPKTEAGRLFKAEWLKQVVNKATDTDPNMYYQGDPGPGNWPVAAVMPEAWQFWKNWANPVVKGLVGLTGLGVLAMLGKQLVMKDEAPAEDGQASEEVNHD